MAIRQTDLKGFRQIIRGANSKIIKAHGLALIQAGKDAEKMAKKNAINNFKENSSKRQATGRRLTGQLLKGISTVFQVSTAELPKVALQVKGVPYAAIHEYGGDITPKKAKNLWIKLDYRSPYKRMTPTEFIQIMGFGRVKLSRGSIAYAIINSKKGNKIAAEIRGFKKAETKIRPLFVLKKRVKMPERPYLRPAAKKAGKQIPGLTRKFLKEQFTRVRRSRKPRRPLR